MAPPAADEPMGLDAAEIDAEIGVVAWADHVHQPDAQLEPAPPPSAPAVVSEPGPGVLGPARPQVSASFEDVEGEGKLSLQGLSAVDMPAIDVETGIVVVPQLEMLQLSTIMGWWELAWLDPDGTRELDPLVDDSPREVRRRVAEVNAKLRASQWRKLERLAVALPNDDFVPDDDTPPGERMVQAIAQHGELILRIPGVRVLERHPLEHGNTSIYRVYADRAFATALVIFMRCSGDNCTCDPVFSAQVVRLDPATFAAIDRRPCIDCESTDFGFNDGDPW